MPWDLRREHMGGKRSVTWRGCHGRLVTETSDVLAPQSDMCHCTDVGCMHLLPRFGTWWSQVMGLATHCEGPVEPCIMSWLAGYDYEGVLADGHVIPAMFFTERQYTPHLNVTTVVHGYKVDGSMAEPVTSAIEFRIHSKEVCFNKAIHMPLHPLSVHLHNTLHHPHTILQPLRSAWHMSTA